MNNVTPYVVVLTPQAQKEFTSLDKKYLQAARKALHRLGQYPFLGQALTAELTGKFKLRFSRYRIIYEINHTKRFIIVQAIRHRKDVYR